MSSTPYRWLTRPNDLRWILLILGILAYLLLLIWERTEHRERSGRIEGLEQTLQQIQIDEALRRVDLELMTGFIVIRKTAKDRGMTAASQDHCYLLAPEDLPAAVEPDLSPLQASSQWITQTLRGGIAEARPSASEAGDVKGAR